MDRLPRAALVDYRAAQVSMAFLSLYQRPALNFLQTITNTFISQGFARPVDATIKNTQTHVRNVLVNNVFGLAKASVLVLGLLEIGGSWFSGSFSYVFNSLTPLRSAAAFFFAGLVCDRLVASSFEEEERLVNSCLPAAALLWAQAFAEAARAGYQLSAEDSGVDKLEELLQRFNVLSDASKNEALEGMKAANLDLLNALKKSGGVARDLERSSIDAVNQTALAVVNKILQETQEPSEIRFRVVGLLVLGPRG